MTWKDPIARPGANMKAKFRPKRQKTLKTGISGSEIFIGIKSPDLSIGVRPDGKSVTGFNILGHHFEDTRL
jgi:hypothetical protein